MTEAVDKPLPDPPARIHVGVIVERRDAVSRWADCNWRLHAIAPGRTSGDDWRLLASGPGWQRFFAGCLPLELHRGETEGYRQNLASDPPRAFVVLRATTDDDRIRPALVTVCPFEAEAYLNSGEDTVESAPLPADLVIWLRQFVDCHHVDRPFVKRKKKSKAHEHDEAFARRPAGRPDDR